MTRNMDVCLFGVTVVVQPMFRLLSQTCFGAQQTSRARESDWTESTTDWEELKVQCCTRSDSSPLTSVTSAAANETSAAKVGQVHRGTVWHTSHRMGSLWLLITDQITSFKIPEFDYRNFGFVLVITEKELGFYDNWLTFEIFLKKLLFCPWIWPFLNCQRQSRIDSRCVNSYQNEVALLRVN